MSEGEPPPPGDDAVSRLDVVQKSGANVVQHMWCKIPLHSSLPPAEGTGVESGPVQGGGHGRQVGQGDVDWADTVATEEVAGGIDPDSSTQETGSFAERDAYLQKDEIDYETDSDDDDEDEVDDNQCTICGKIYEEDNKGLIVHVEEVHKDYYFDEDNSLLLREDFLSKEKCMLCLENFKNGDVQQHMKVLHPYDYEETDIKINYVKSDHHEETNMETDNIEETDLKQAVSGNKVINNQFKTQRQRLVKNIIINDDDNEGENNSVKEPIVSKQKNFPKHAFTDSSLISFTAPLPMKPEPGPAHIKTEPKVQYQISNGQSLPTNKPAVTGREAPYKCNQCDIKYYVRSHLQVHNERMHKKCKWKCDVCLTVHTNEADLKQHRATPQHKYTTRTLWAKHPLPSYQPNQNYQFLPRQFNQNAQPLPNRQLNQNQLSLPNVSNQQAQYLSNNKFPPAGTGPIRQAQFNTDKWNTQGDISQLNTDKWLATPQSNPATQNKTSNTQYNPPQYIPQPRSRTYVPQEPKPDTKPITPQPIVPKAVKPTPPPSPPRPMLDPFTKSHLAKVSQICRDLRLFDYPVPVTPSSKAMFKDPLAFGAYLLPLLMSVNPHAKMQDLGILGKAKWVQILESQTGAMDSPATSPGSVGVVYTGSLGEHLQHLQILQSMGVQ